MNEIKEYCVYKHTAPNGKVYIGQTCQKPEQRWKNGNGYSNNEYFTRAIKKYGWENFNHEILYSGLTRDESDKLEIELILKYNSTDKNFGFNIENGGYGKGKHSLETLIKMSDGRKGIPAWNKGLPMSEEQKMLISNKNTGRTSSFKGRHHNDDAKKKLSDSQSKKKIPVLCVETNVIYESLRDAERKTGIKHRDISLVCSGEIYNGKKRLTAGGYHWRYIDMNGENKEAV